MRRAAFLLMALAAISPSALAEDGVRRLDDIVRLAERGELETALDLADAPSLELGQLERAAVAEALRRTSGNQVKAARLLGITRFTLRRRMALYGLDGDPQQG